jgi:hypothetical protein
MMPDSKKSGPAVSGTWDAHRGRGGRAKWIPPDLKEVEFLAETGLTYVQIAAKLGISTDTLERRRKENAAFAEAINRGRAKGVASVSNALYTNALSGNVAAQIFIMKCVGGWKSSERVEVSGANGGPVDVSATLRPDKEMAAILEGFVDIARTAAESAADAGDVPGDADGEEPGTAASDSAGESVDP